MGGGWEDPPPPPFSFQIQITNSWPHTALCLPVPRLPLSRGRERTGKRKGSSEGSWPCRGPAPAQSPLRFPGPLLLSLMPFKGPDGALAASASRTSSAFPTALREQERQETLGAASLPLSGDQLASQARVSSAHPGGPSSETGGRAAAPAASHSLALSLAAEVQCPGVRTAPAGAPLWKSAFITHLREPALV